MDTMENLEAFFDVDDEDAAADVDEDETDTEETEGGLLIHFILDKRIRIYSLGFGSGSRNCPIKHPNPRIQIHIFFFCAD